MEISESQKNVILRTLNAVETGTIQGNYSQVTVIDDDPKHPGKEISYGKNQVTEFTHLHELLDNYVRAGGEYKYNVSQYLPKVGVKSLSGDAEFLALLRNIGNDPVMQRLQDNLFNQRYYLPALNWASKAGFTLPLSLLVIYDSFIHSGGILYFLRNRFSECTPFSGGNEKRWIGQYTQARHDWLSFHESALLRNSAYRTKCYIQQINAENWDLSKPFVMNGVRITGD